MGRWIFSTWSHYLWCCLQAANGVGAKTDNLLLVINEYRGLSWRWDELKCTFVQILIVWENTLTAHLFILFHNNKLFFFYFQHWWWWKHYHCDNSAKYVCLLFYYLRNGTALPKIIDLKKVAQDLSLDMGRSRTYFIYHDIQIIVAFWRLIIMVTAEQIVSDRVTWFH